MTDRTRWDRRSFLKGATLATVGSALDPRRLMAVGLQGQSTAGDFGQRLRGPIMSIPTPFDAGFRLDLGAIRRMIAGARSHNIPIYQLTSGDGQYAFLSYDEIKQLAATITKAADGDIVIVGTGRWWTARAMEFAQFAESIGATALQVQRPNGGDERACVEHYRRVASSTRLPIVLHGQFSMELLEHLVEIPTIVALKEDVSLEYYIDTAIRFGKRLNCFSGGGLHWFKVGQPYGSVAYFDAFAPFAPQVTARFWDAVQANDEATQVEIIRNYNHPWIKNFSHPFWRATLEYFGVGQRYLRPPRASYSDEQMLEVKRFYDTMQLVPQK